MASPNERTRNNVRAGIFVSFSILLAIVTIVLLTDALKKFTRPTTEYTVVFDVNHGVKNLKQGGKVRVGGVDMGVVKSVVPDIVPGKPLQRIRVTFSLDHRIQLYKNVHVLVTSALIGADAWLEIVDVGDPANGEVTEFDGYSGAGMLTQLLGPSNAEKADEIVENIRMMTDDAKMLVGRIEDEDWPRWAGQVDSVMDWADTAPDKIDAVFDEARGMLADARATVVDNRPQIDGIVDNVNVASADVREIARRFREESVDKVNAVLDRGREAMEEAVTLLENVDREFDGWAPDLSDILASGRLAAQQIKLAMIEVRRSPWKLLYKPEKAELEHELLYEAARTFAMAVSDLRAASQSTERLMSGHSAEIQTDPELQRRITQFLSTRIENYENAQQQLLDVLLAD